MSEKREFPILNGRLLSDLDANGHKIIRMDYEVTPEKIKEAVAPELEAKAAKTALEAEVSRAKGAEAALGEEIAKKVDANIDSKGRINFNEPIRLNAPLIVNTDKEGAGLFKGDIDNPYVSEGRASSIAGTIANNAVKAHNDSLTVHTHLFALKQDKLEAGANITLTPNGETVLIDAIHPDLTPYAMTAEVLPRYRFMDAEIADGVLTIAPYTNAKLTSDGTAFAVAVGGESDYMRDCVLVVDCGETLPSVIFDDTVFFPRGGDAANLEVVAGKRNVFFITEVQPNVFMVARDELALPNEGGGE